MKLITSLLFLALVVAATASSFSSDSFESSESTCRKEIQRQPLDKCRQFIKSGRRQSDLILMGTEDEDEDEEATPPKDCCTQVKRMSEGCRCPNIRSVVQEIVREGKGSGEQTGYCKGQCGEEMMALRGRTLPAMCGLQPYTCRMKPANSD